MARGWWWAFVGLIPWLGPSVALAQERPTMSSRGVVAGVLTMDAVLIPACSRRWLARNVAAESEPTRPMER